MLFPSLKGNLPSLYITMTHIGVYKYMLEGQKVTPLLSVFVPAQTVSLSHHVPPFDL